MLKEKTLSMLGLARKAGRLSMGHDAAVKSMTLKKARLLIFCSDISPRLISEFERRAEKINADIPIVKVDITINEIHFCTGFKAGVLTVDDENFAKKIYTLITQEENANGNKA